MIMINRKALLYLTLLVATFQSCVTLEISSDDLLSYPSRYKRSVEKCCKGDHYLSCQQVDLNFQDFDQMKRTITVHGINLTFVRKVPPTGFIYKNNQGDEAVFSYNKLKRKLSQRSCSQRDRRQES